MTGNAEYILNENKVSAHHYRPLPVVLSRGQGVWLWDIEENRYCDMMSAYSAVSHGHCHPRLVRTLSEQSQQLCITSRAFHAKTYQPFLEKICQMTGLDKVLIMNSGAEAVETALKAARAWGYQYKKIPKNKAKIIVAQNNFHGRTLSIVSFSSDPLYKEGFGPLTPGFVEIPFGDQAALRKAITPNTCAFLVEPMQGEAGIHIPPKGWLNECAKICQENNVLLILDEIQTGLGRTGRLFAFEHENVQPDGLILGKALGGGLLPVSAFVAKEEVMSVFTPGRHGSTFGGNPLACAVGLEALRIIEEDEYAERSQKLGDVLLKALQKIKSPLIKNCRGKGLWIGVEIDTQKISAYDLCVKLMQNGVLTKEAHQTVIRFAPPLVITEEELAWGIERIEQTFAIRS